MPRLTIIEAQLPKSKPSSGYNHQKHHPEENYMLKVGYIGLGLMGKSIARNILKAGFPLVVHNRSRAAVNELVAEGATAAESPAEVAGQVDVVFTNLPDSPDVEKVVSGPGGILEAAHAGRFARQSVFVDNSTIKPGTARMLAVKLAEEGIFALDAPVSGGDIGAKNGTLTIMVGGDASALERVMPVFLAMGKTVTHVGHAGAGQVAKAANQIMVAAQMVAMGELLVFSQKAGVDPQKVVEAIKGGAAQCWTLDVKPPRLFAGNRGPGFKAYMQAKDLNIVLETAREYGVPLPGTAENAQLFNAMLQMGMGELDNSAVVGVIELLAGIKLKES
jgi:2-hydroxy-3-oxopropionate reductase